MTTSAELDALVEGQTVFTRFCQVADEHPGAVALRRRLPDGSWEEWTFADLRARVGSVAAALAARGVAAGDRVVLMMRNIPEFHAIDLAVAYLGATPISVYNSSSPDQVAYLAANARAVLAIVEDAGFGDRVAAVADQLPDLRAVLDLSVPEVRAELLDRTPLEVTADGARCTPDTAATVIYTSGTTGPPKGVIITHRNLLWTTEAILSQLDIEPLGMDVVSYLPMAHIAERMATHYLAVMGGLRVTTCPDTGLLHEYLLEVRPQLLFGVPRVWEKLYNGVQAALVDDPDRRTALAEAVAAAAPIVDRRAAGEATEEDEATWAFLDEVAFSQVRTLLGLDRVQYAFSGAAPMPAELVSWFRAVGVPLSEIYGMSETTAFVTWEPHRVKAGTVGRPLAGSEVFLADDGEVCVRGGNVFTGYLDDPEKTADALDETGALHTGDIGAFDDEGYLRIIDRKKELIITAGGKNISPANLEAALRTIPLVGQAVAIGDQRPYVAALVTLDPDVAPAWAKERGISYGSLEELAKHPEVVAEIELELGRVMSQFNNAERVKRFTVLPNDWQPDSVELTPTAKLRRKEIHAKYREEIERLYS